MAIFNLTDNEISRLKKKFDEFQSDRARLHEIIIDYTVDYRQFQGTSSERQEYLRRKYTQKAPKLSHLVWDNDEEIYWSAAEISIVMGRDRSSITRTLANMEKEDGWCSRLLVLRKTSKAGSGLDIYVYHQDIFDLIIDHYEEEYLLRFSQPRRGDPEQAPDIKEVRRFWNYLKTRADFQKEQFIEQEFPDVPPMSWKDIFYLIWQKLFNIKTGTVLSIIFAASFELARRWTGIAPWFTAVSILIFISCVLLIRFRRKNPIILASLGAGALLFAILWTVGLLSSDGVIHTPTGATLTLYEPDEKLEIVPVLYGETGQINFNIISGLQNAKEFLYRVSPDVEYHSTGFFSQNNISNNALSPKATITNTKSNGIIGLDIKYIDKNDKERGPFTFSFNIDAERFKLRKKFIMDIKEPWVTAYRLHRLGMTFVMTDSIFYSSAADETISALVYGLNTEQPNITLTQKSIRQLEEPFQILMTDKDDIQYVTSFVIFKDGTSSDIRRDDLSIK